MYIRHLKTRGYRNLKEVNLSLPKAGVFALYGQNGAGKTNFLEALSMLSPGQGLYRDKLENMMAFGYQQWSVFAEVENLMGLHKLGMLYSKKKRHMRLDGENITQQAELAKLGAVLWFTPEMDRLFAGSPTPRRRFFDRLVFSVNPQHAANLSGYTRHIQNRSKLLKLPNPDAQWLDIEEQKAAKFATKIVRDRFAYLENLQAYFESISLELKGTVERTAQTPEAEGEEALEHLFITKFKENRERDARFGGNSFGPHRMDLSGELLGVTSLERASMGQHKKAMLLILFAAAQLQKHVSGQAPCLLLDEVATHLDANARHILYEQLVPLGGQIWLTGTEKSYFNELQTARFIHMADGAPKPEF